MYIPLFSDSFVKKRKHPIEKERKQAIKVGTAHNSILFSPFHCILAWQCTDAAPQPTAWCLQPAKLNPKGSSVINLIFYHLFSGSLLVHIYLKPRIFWIQPCVGACPALLWSVVLDRSWASSRSPWHPFAAFFFFSRVVCYLQISASLLSSLLFLSCACPRAASRICPIAVCRQAAHHNHDSKVPTACPRRFLPCKWEARFSKRNA